MVTIATKNVCKMIAINQTNKRANNNYFKPRPIIICTSCETPVVIL